MIETLRNAWRIPELRKKLLFTFFILAIYRLGSVIPVPYIDLVGLNTVFESYRDTLLGYFNVLSGGALSNATIFALSIQPYINASIIVQLLTVAIPALERLAKDGGEEGQKKIASITRYVTIIIGVIMGVSYYFMLRNSHILTNEGVWAALVIIVSFIAGAALIMWLGEQITDRGIGNGISIILFAGIISRVPSMVVQLYQLVTAKTIGWIGLIGIVVLALAVIAFVVFIEDGERRIPVQYAKRVVGRKMYGGQATNLPIKVNMSGVMPIIFASSVLQLPGTIAIFFQPKPGTFWSGFVNFFSQQAISYMILYFLFIIAFAYFYSSISFNPVEVANNLRKNGGFVLGFRPGKPTSDFIRRVVSKITFIGALCLSVVALLPLVLGKITGVSGLSIGGTSVLIVVGVALETVKEMEAQMMMRHYKGFLD